MNTIPCKVRTNVDWLQRKEWPREVSCKPEKGEHMISKDGVMAKIVGIYHSHSGLEIEIWEQPKQ